MPDLSRCSARRHWLESCVISRYEFQPSNCCYCPDLDITDPDDEHATQQADRLRIGLLENGINLIATLPADVFLSEHIAQLQPDLELYCQDLNQPNAMGGRLAGSRPTPKPCWR